MRRRAYIAIYPGGARRVLVTDDTESTKRHALPPSALWGPFSSRKAAEWIAPRSYNNPHMSTVSEAERIYRQYKEEARP